MTFMDNSRKDLYISFGSLDQDTKIQDIRFWQQGSIRERFQATAELCRTAEKRSAHREGRKEITGVDKNTVVYGSLKN